MPDRAFEKLCTYDSYATHGFLDGLLGVCCIFLSQNNLYIDAFICCQLIVSLLNSWSPGFSMCGGG